MQKLFIEEMLWNSLSDYTKELLKKSKTITHAYDVIMDECYDELLDEEDAVYENTSVEMFRTSEGVYFQAEYGGENFIEVGKIERD